LLQQRQHLRFRLNLVLLYHLHYKERNFIEIGPSPCIRVIADHQRKLAMQLTVLLAIEQIGEAVVESRQKNRDPWPVAGERYPPRHLEALGNRSKVPMKLGHREIESVQVPLKTHQE